MLSQWLARVGPKEQKVRNTPQLANVLAALQLISSEMELDALVATLVRVLLAQTTADQIFVLIQSPTGIAVIGEGERGGAPRVYAPGLALEERSVINVGLLQEAQTSGQAAIEQHASTKKPQAEIGLSLCIPLRKHNSVAGWLYVQWRQVARLPEMQIELLQILATQAAIALENARLYAELKQEMTDRERAEATLRAITEGTAALSGDDFFRSLVCHLAAAFQVRCAFVTECSGLMPARVQTLAFLEEGEIADNFEYELAGTPCELVIGGAEAYFPERLGEQFLGQAKEGSYLGMPLRNAAGTVIGHLVVLDNRSMHRDTREKALMATFAARAGIELERRQTEAALHQSQVDLRTANLQLEDYSRNLEEIVAERTNEIERRQQVAESLRAMLMLLNSNRSLHETLSYIVNAASNLLGTDSGAIYDLQEDGVTLALQASCGLPEEYRSGLAFPLQHSFMGRAVTSRQPVVVSDLRAALVQEQIDLEPWRKELLSRHYQTLLAVPLVRLDGEVAEVYGGYALYYHSPHHLGEEELRLAMAFGAQAALAIETARLRQQAERAAVMEERSRLARELHDSVTQSLYSLTLLAEGWRRMAKAGQAENVADWLEELGQIGQQALKEMRLLIYELRPPDLAQEGLLGALYQRLGAVEKRAGVEARLVAGELGDLSPLVEDALYGIAQEALNNTLKHAAASVVTLQLTRETEHILLEVKDNGCGFLPEKLEESGLGLRTMRERAQHLAGTLEVKAEPGGGTCVCARVPLATAAHLPAGQARS